MNKSEDIKDLAGALCKAQSEMSGAKKKAANPYFKSKYANLEEVIHCAKDALMNNGLSVSQFPVTNETQAGVTTLLMHNSGQWIEDTLLLKCAKLDPQGMGSAITYARRYAYQSILGIPSEDDDGQAASTPKKPNYTAPTKPQPPQAPKPQQIISAFKLADNLQKLEEKKAKADSFALYKSDPVIVAAYEQRKKELTELSK